MNVTSQVTNYFFFKQIEEYSNIIPDNSSIVLLLLLLRGSRHKSQSLSRYETVWSTLEQRIFSEGLLFEALLTNSARVWTPEANAPESRAVCYECFEKQPSDDYSVFQGQPDGLVPREALASVTGAPQQQQHNR